MKLILQNNRIAATATDEYTGPDAYISTPADYVPDQMANYTVAGGVLILLAPVVSMRAFRKALTQAGLRQAVEDYVATASIEVRDDWTTAQNVARDYPLIVAAGAALGQDDVAMDSLFALAKQIEAGL
jgi:hypothetical protein